MTRGCQSVQSVDASPLDKSGPRDSVEVQTVETCPGLGAAGVGRPRLIISPIRRVLCAINRVNESK